MKTFTSFMKKMLSKKPLIGIGYVIIGTVIIAALVGVTRAGYYRSLTNPEALAMATGDWQTYQIPKCECSFKYPSDWKVVIYKELLNATDGQVDGNYVEKDIPSGFLIMPKDTPNDWIQERTGQVGDDQYGVSYGPTYVGHPIYWRSRYINSISEAAKSGVQFFPGGSGFGGGYGFNSGAGPLYSKSTKLGNNTAKLQLGVFDPFYELHWNRAVHLISYPTNFKENSPIKSYGTAEYYWPPSKTIVQILATFTFKQ